MTQQNEILIHLGQQGWLATFTGARGAEIETAFGARTLPTAFTACAALATVIAEISKLNPGFIVRHWAA